MRWLVGILLGAPIIFGAAFADAARSRGISVELRTSEAPGAPSAGRVQLYSTSYALVIGIDDYTAGWPRLEKAIEDARAVARSLSDKGFQVTRLENPDGQDLQAALKSFFAIKGREPESRLILWYSGHGHTIGDEGFLVPVDAPLPTDPWFKAKALHMRDFGGLMRLAEAKHVLSVFDSCFSGTIFRAKSAPVPRSITKKTTKKVRQFLTSGSADEQVRDDGTYRILFQRALEGAANFNNDDYITGEELGLYLSQEVSAITEAAQTPQYGKLQAVRFREGDFVFKLAALTDGGTATPTVSRPPARTPAPSGIDPREIILDSGLTLADWILLAGDRTDSAALLEEAATYRQEHGRIESLEALIDETLSSHMKAVRSEPRLKQLAALDGLKEALGERAEIAAAHTAMIKDMRVRKDWDAARVLAEVRSLKQEVGPHVDLLAEEAEALHHLGRTEEAVKIYQAWLRTAEINDKSRKKMAGLLLAASKGAPLFGLEGQQETLFVQSKVNVRSGPDTSYSVTGSMERGAEISPQRVSGKPWYAVEGGYISASALHSSHPDVLAAAAAKAAKDKAAWDAARGSGTISGFADYLTAWPQGQHAKEAEREAWARAKALSSVRGYEVYLQRFASGPHVAEARREKEKEKEKEKTRPGNAFRDCDDCPELVVVPSGNFRMGDLNGGGYDDEKPVHEVRIPKDFAVGKYEVTQAEWRNVMGNNPSEFKGNRNPVERVSWNDAKAFVSKLSARTGKQYRLLSEAEWEYAARAGTSTKWHCGNNGSCLDSVAVYAVNSGDRSHPVGSKSANAFGLHDMLGNVFELVEDCWNNDYVGAPTDGSANTSGDCSRRMNRGGDLSTHRWNLRPAKRDWNGTAARYSYIGFRVARDLSRDL